MFGYNGYKKSGFTLAEILITLGIVGTVAAMTIPTLMMNYQKQVWESKLKKTFSIATNACERMLIEENVSKVNETEVYGTISDTTLKKYFKIMQPGQSVTASGDVKCSGYSIYLPDSAVLYLSTSTDGDDSGFYFCTDVNGVATRPNTVGRDVFEFRLDENCAYDSDLGEGASAAATAFKNVVDNDWKIPD